MRDWRSQEVTRHNRGVTDDIENSPPEFQERCENLINQKRTQALGSRQGSQYWYAFDAPATIRQLFRLENYIFAYCYDDPTTPGDNVLGKIYWVLEDGTSTAWTEVETVKYSGLTGGGFDSDFRPVFIKEGHIQISEWEGHLYLSLEPYDKSFTPNAGDLDVTDPDTFPPDNDREELRKLYIEWDSSTQTATPRCVNAQLPKAGIHPYIRENDGGVLPPWATTSWGSPYFYHTLLFRADNGAGGNFDIADDAQIRIISEAGWGSGNLVADDVVFEYSVAAGSPLSCTASIGSFDAVKTRIELDIVGSSAEPVTFQELVDVIDAALDTLKTTDTRMKDIDHSVFIGDYAEPTTKIVVGAAVPAGQKEFNNYAGTSLQEDGGENGFGWYMSFKEEINATDNAPALYTYTFFAREEYVALVESTPRTFIFDGPVAQVQLGAFRDHGEAETGVLREYRRAVPIAGAFAKTVDVEPFDLSTIKVNNLYDWTGGRIKGVFARTEINGTVSYVEEQVTAYSNGILNPGTIPAINSNTTFFQTHSEYKVATYDYRKNDRIIRNNEQTYFSGDSRFYSSLAQGPYYFDIANQLGYYGNILNLQTRVYQSLPGVPHATAFDFFLDFDEPITAINHFLEKPIVFTLLSTWRLEGKKGADGRGQFFSRVVSNEFGCVANQSVVRTNVGLFYWSRQGIIYTDGLRAFRVNEHWLEGFRTVLNNTRTSDTEIGPRELRGTYDEVDQRVQWSALDADGFPIWVVLDLRQGVSKQMCIQTGKGDTLRLNFADLSGSSSQITIPMFQTNANLYSEETNKFYRTQDKRILIHDESYYYDEFYMDPALFNGVQTNYAYFGSGEVLKNPVKPFMKSIGFSYGTKQHRKWTSRVMINMRDQSEKGVSFQPLGWNDLGRKEHKLPTCLNYQHLPFSLDYATFPVQDVEQFFKHQDCKVDNELIATFRRRFPKGRIRNTYKQFGFRELPIYTTRVLASAVDPTAVPSSNAIEVIYKNSTVDWVQIILKYNDINDSVITALSMKLGGIWYVKWGDGDDWHRIEDVVHHEGVKAMFSVSWPQAAIASDQSINVDYIDLAMVPTDQPIELLDYALTYTIIGDRTHGIFKGPGDGANNGDV